MTYYIVDQNPALMKGSFFYYRNNMQNEDEIVAIVDDEFSSENDLLKTQKKLLKLEGEYRAKYQKWYIPPVKLNTVFLPKFSL